MARPKSDDKRNAIVAAAVRVIAAQGLGAPTAAIAEAAGVSNGSLFTYFETKADLLNQVYIDLKTEMAAAALDGLPTKADVRAQMFHMWSRWLRWATAAPEKRRALARLGVSDDVTVASRKAAGQSMLGVAALLEKSRAQGPMRDAPMAFVAAIMNSIAEATMDYMLQDPSHATKHCKVGFEALWRVVT